MEQEIELLNRIRQKSYEKPEFIRDMVEAFIFGTKEKIKDMSETILKKDRAITVLFDRSDLGSEQNLIDTAEQLTRNLFNGIEKYYTIEDVKKSFKK